VLTPKLPPAGLPVSMIVYPGPTFVPLGYFAVAVTMIGMPAYAEVVFSVRLMFNELFKTGFMEICGRIIVPFAAVAHVTQLT
jgi:hypothetical protein